MIWNNVFGYYFVYLINILIKSGVYLEKFNFYKSITESVLPINTEPVFFLEDGN